MLSEYNYHTRVMGCDFDMTFVAKTVDEADNYFIMASRVAESYEKRFSRFDNDSELSRINIKKSMPVSREFLDVYMIAYDLYKKTGGQFNPLIQLARIGYDRSFENIGDGDLFKADDSHYNMSMDDIMIDKKILILQKTHKLDFGGFLKGYVVQKIANEIPGDNGAIINIGGDIYVRGRDHEDRSFIIEIAHPDYKKENIFVPIVDGALCTSGTYKRRWKQDDEEVHHIMDARTKESSQENIISASVIHENGAIADAYATYAITLGSKAARDFFLVQDVQFVIICSNGDILKSDIFK